MALILRRLGVIRVRPLEGGFDGWQARGFPVEPVMPASAQPGQRSGSV